MHGFCCGDQQRAGVYLRLLFAFQEGTGDGMIPGEPLTLGSLPRQLGDQMTLCKSYAVIAKENNNLQLAWHLSAQIRAAQQLLSSVSSSLHFRLPATSMFSLVSAVSHACLFRCLGCYSRNLSCVERSGAHHARNVKSHLPSQRASL